MRKILILTSVLLFCAVSMFAQKKTTNRYGMELKQSEDGTYSLTRENRYSAIINLDEVSDLLVPYTYTSDKLSSALYRGIETKEFVYKTYPTYELKLAVDVAVSDSPAPFMMYFHGGGWARGSFTSNRPLSMYMAKNHGIAGVRIEYTLAPQQGANINVTLEDVYDAVDFIKAHAEELNIDPNTFGFAGGSAGAHLAAMAAMKKGGKVFVGVVGIYDLQKAAISVKATQAERIKYFLDKDERVLHDVSPINNIPENKDQIAACYLISGTGDITVESEQSRLFAEALERNGGVVQLEIRDNYDHGIGDSGSDLMEELFFKRANFIAEHLKK